MHIFVDRSAVEVFGNNSETVNTDQIFPDPYEVKQHAGVGQNK